MADRPAKAGVAARDLEIGVADAGQHDAHERLATRLGGLDLDERRGAVADAQRSHDLGLSLLLVHGALAQRTPTWALRVVGVLLSR